MPLYRIVDRSSVAAPVLVTAFDGWVDAGRAATTAADQLVENSRVVATFDADELFDYRARRPTLDIVDGTLVALEWPELHLRAARIGERELLVLTGPEPDYRWEAFTAAVIHLVERLGVTSAVALQAVPMPVPHTRPVTVTAHATRRQLIDDYPVYWSEMRVPGSAAALLELRLGEAGVDALGVAAHVPHYLAQAAWPAASLGLLEHLGRLTGLLLPTETLREAAQANRTEIDEQIARSSDNTAVVAALEQRYDEFTAARESSDLLGGAGEVPSGDELGAEFERFLAEQDRRRGE